MRPFTPLRLTVGRFFIARLDFVLRVLDLLPHIGAFAAGAFAAGAFAAGAFVVVVFMVGAFAVVVFMVGGFAVVFMV